MTPRLHLRRQRGFTLIEMLAVLAIVGLLAASAHPLLALHHQRRQEEALRLALRQMRTALDAYKRLADEGRLRLPAGASGWPASLQQLDQGIEVVERGAPSSQAGRRLYLLRRLPRDPFADPAIPAAETWATRPSDSPPGNWQAGADVFDVASRSSARALDGSRYLDW